MRHAPHLLDVEVAQVLRKFVLRGQTSAERAQRALHDLEEFPLRRHGHASLLSRVFELRANHTAYDGIYLALSESLGAPLLTCDAGLVKSPSSTAAVELVR
jgi:predicted nucleic acid-binding protein